MTVVVSLPRWVLKGCPRCKGDLILGAVDYGLEYSCLQCGYHRKPIKRED